MCSSVPTSPAWLTDPQRKEAMPVCGGWLQVQKGKSAGHPERTGHSPSPGRTDVPWPDGGCRCLMERSFVHILGRSWLLNKRETSPEVPRQAGCKDTVGREGAVQMPREEEPGTGEFVCL